MPLLLSEFEPYDHPQSPGAPGKYPWDQWLDGQTREFARAEDFDGSISSFISSAQRAAKLRGLYLRTTRDKNRGLVRIQAGAAPFPSTRKSFD